MKKLLVLFSILSFAFSIANAQSTIAKLKYQDAEEAFAKEDYRTTITKLTEAEKLLGTTNPKIMYLKIVAQNSLIKSDSKFSFQDVQLLRKDCLTYLKHYEKNTGIEEKYREVYKISESLSDYSASEESFNKIKSEKESKVLAIKTLFSFTDSLAAIYHFKPGITASEFLSLNPSINNTSWVSSYSATFFGFPTTSYSKKIGLSVKKIFESGFNGYIIDSERKVVNAGWNMDGDYAANKAIAYVQANLPDKYFKLSKNKYSGADMLVISVPNRNKPEEISYYISIAVSAYKKISCSSFNLATDKRLLLIND